jgi:hypothetical protein
MTRTLRFALLDLAVVALLAGCGASQTSQSYDVAHVRAAFAQNGLTNPLRSPTGSSLPYDVLIYNRDIRVYVLPLGSDGADLTIRPFDVADWKRENFGNVVFFYANQGRNSELVASVKRDLRRGLPVKFVGDDPAKVGLGRVVKCFKQEGWSILVVQGKTNPQSVLALPPGTLSSRGELLDDIPTFWVYPSAREAAAKIGAVRADRARKGGSVPGRVGRVIYWWGTTKQPLPEVVATVRLCARSV